MKEQISYSKNDQATEFADYDNNAVVCDALRDKLVGALIGMARATDGNDAVNTGTWKILIEGLYAFGAGADCDADALREKIGQVQNEKQRLKPMCALCADPCGRTSDFDMRIVRSTEGSLQDTKLCLLSDLHELAAVAQKALNWDEISDELGWLLARAVFSLGEDWDQEDYLMILKELKLYREKF